MAKAQLGDYAFDINPRSMSWSYRLYTKSDETYGGRVIQLLSCKIESVTLQGYLPIAKGERTIRDGNGNEKTVPLIGLADNQYAEMERFEDTILSMMDRQAESKKAIRFSFPALGYTGQVYITSYGDISYSIDDSAISYTLQLTVDDGFEGLKVDIGTEAQASLDSIPDGINWTYNKYNTPVSGSWQRALSVIENILNDSGNYGTVSLYDYYEQMMEEEKKEKRKKALKQASSKISAEAVMATIESALDSDKSTADLVASATGGIFGALKLSYSASDTKK